MVETVGSRATISEADERRYCELYPTGRRGDSAAVSLGRRNWDQERVSPHRGEANHLNKAAPVSSRPRISPKWLREAGAGYQVSSKALSARRKVHDIAASARLEETRPRLHERPPLFERVGP